MARKSTSPLAAGLSRCGQYFVYLLFRALELLLAILPLTLVAAVGRILGAISYFVAWKYRRLARENLRIAFGREMTAAQQRRIAWRHFQSLGSNFFCGLKLPLMTEKQIATRISVAGFEHAEALTATGRPLLYAVSHLSCWELLTRVPALVSPKGTQPASIYQRLGNPFLNAHLRRRREQLGYLLFDRKEGFSAPMKHLRENAGALGVLVDQHAGDSGIWCPLFDRLASTTTLPALLAKRCDTPLLPIAVQDAGLARWRITVHPPVVSGDLMPSPEGLTAALNLVLELIIRAAPENWFWVHNRWKTPNPDFLRAKHKRGGVLPQGYEMRRLQRFEVLVRSPNWLGDACMAFPAVRALKNARPDLRLSVFTPAKLRELWSALGLVDEVISKDSKDGLLRASGRIKSTGRHYDAGLLFTNSTRSTLEFWLAGIPRLVGYKGSLRAWLVDQITPEPKPGRPPEHQALRGLRMVRHAGADTDSKALLTPPGPTKKFDPMVIGICAGAEYGPAKRWPLERFAETITLVAAERPEVKWKFFGAPGEAEMGEKLSAMVKAEHQNMVGKTALPELIWTLGRCKLLVTNDTGTMHLAAALGVPTVSIFGSTEPVLTGPLGPDHTVIRHQVPCSPCFKRECPFGHYDCMTGISPKEVAEKVLAAIRAV